MDVNNCNTPKGFQGKIIFGNVRIFCVRTKIGEPKWGFRLRRQFMRYVAVKMASPNKYFGTFIVNIKAQATSNRWRFFLFETPFCYGVSTQTLMNNTILQQIVTQKWIEVFFIIVNSKHTNSGLELVLNHVFEIFKYLACFLFFSKKIYTNDSCVIINESDKPSFSIRGLNFWWPPSITMIQGERSGWYTWSRWKRSVSVFSKLTYLTLKRYWIFIIKYKR